MIPNPRLVNKNQAVVHRKKKYMDVKYQCNLARIRMDGMLKNRLENIQKRLENQKKTFIQDTTKARFELTDLAEREDCAIEKVNSSLKREDDTFKVYSS